MFQKTRICILFILIFLVKCKIDENIPTADLYRIEIEYESKKVISSSELLNPESIFLIDSFIFLTNVRQEPILEVYNLKGLLLKKMISLGKGPNEFLRINNIDYDSRENEILIYDNRLQKILGYKLNKLFQDDYEPILKWHGGEDVSELVNNIRIINEKQLLACSFDPQGRIAIINENKANEFFISFPDKSNVDSRLNDIQNARLYVSRITYNNHTGKFALGTFTGSNFIIGEIKNNMAITTFEYTDFYPNDLKIVSLEDKVIVANTQKTINGYLDIKSTGNFIYALHSGKPRYYKSNKIRVIDWNGENDYVIKLDKEVSALAVSKDDELIYGLVNDELENKEVYVFKRKNE